MDSPHAKTDPSVTTGRVSTPPSTGPIGPKPIWRLDLTPLVLASAGVILYEIHLVNVSTSALIVPVSQDGVKLAAACPEHTVRSLILALSRRDERFSTVRMEEFYGCEAQPDSLAYLGPGEWISFVGRAQWADIKTDVRATSILSRVRYTQTANGMVSDRGQTTDLYSPWHSLPN